MVYNTLVGFTALSAKELRAGQQGIMLLATLSPVAPVVLLQPEFLSPKSRSGYSGRTGKYQMVSRSSHGRAASRYVMLGRHRYMPTG